jgi:predicted nucleic acid-binding protein
MGNNQLPIVVSDAGPLIYLSQINQLTLLRGLFSEVLISERVKFEACDEGLRLHYPDAAAIANAIDNQWLKVEAVPKRLITSAVKLASGENISKADAESLLLAVDKKAELVVDEKLLSSLAKMYGLKIWSTWTILLEALSRNLIVIADIEAAVEELGKRKFKLNSAQAQAVLEAAKYIEKQKEKS